MDITFKHFTPRSNPEYFHPYLELMYKVYICEQGWKLESNHRRKKIEVTLEDINSVFVVAVDSDDKVIGGIKATIPTYNFPGKEIFGHHMGYQGMERCRDAISVAKGLVLTDEYRHRKFLINGKEKSLGSALIDQLLLLLTNHGAKMVFGSATVYQAAIQMQNAGFRIIDEAVKYDGPSKAALHMAWTEDKEALKYFKNREKVLLGSLTDIDFAKKHLKSSEKQQKRTRASVG